MKKKKKMSIKNKEARSGLLFVSPWIFGFIVFTLYPILSSLYYSLCEYRVTKPPVFIGLENYRMLFQDPIFLKALSNTLYLVIFGAPIVTILAISIAIMSQNKKLKHTGVFRIMFFIPTLVPTIVASLVWIWVMQPDTGIVNRLLGYIGISGPGWLSSIFWSKPAFIMLMLWTCGNAIIIYLAGLQDIPDSLYESASLDGAGFIKQTTSITIPLLRSTILYNGVTLVIGIFQWFAEPYIMTNGGPDNSTMLYSLYLYQNAFTFFKMGYASAMGWILLLIGLAIVLVLFKVFKFGESEY
jgi:ABC-type sugar transport systems, permease components